MVQKFPLVKEYMISPVFTLKNTTTIYEAMDFLIKKRISGAPIVDSHNKLVGILSEKDCLRLMSKGVEHRLPARQELVENFMTKEVVTISADVDIFFVAGIFLNNFYRRLPVVNDGKILGLVSRVDILRGMRDYLRERGIK